jgi:hypothetical protein
MVHRSSMFESNTFFDRSDSEWTKGSNRPQWPANAFCPIDMKKNVGEGQQVDAEYDTNVTGKIDIRSL